MDLGFISGAHAKYLSPKDWVTMTFIDRWDLEKYHIKQTQHSYKNGASRNNCMGVVFWIHFLRCSSFEC